MKNILIPLRFSLLAGVAASVIVLAPTSSLLADDSGGTGGHHGGDDPVIPIATGTGTADDHGNGGGETEPGDDHGNGGNGGADDHNKTEFLGTIQSLPTTADFIGAWKVDGRIVNVSTGTVIRTEHGVPAVGGKVEVEGPVLADGSVQATRVKTEDAERELEDNVFFGPVQALPDSGVIGTWLVGGLTVQVSDTTRVETESGAPVIGSFVRVEGIQQPDASIVATEIEIQPAAVASTLADSKKVKIKGIIQQLPPTLGKKGNWVVNGVVITVSDDSTRVAGGRQPKVGRQVVIKGKQQINGSVFAGKVNVPDSH